MRSHSRTFSLTAALAILAALPIHAQRPPAAECRLNFRSNFRLNGAQQHLTAADAANHPSDKLRRANDAMRVLLEAARERGADELTLWVFLGRAYALKGDLAGADSAWRRAEAVGDDACRQELTRRRRNEYIAFNNAAVDHLQADRLDSALAQFRRGMVIFLDPAALITVGNIFMQQEREDSAVAYWRRAAHASAEPRTLEARSTALFNAARVMQRAGRLAQADTLYREYIRMMPGDMEARASLAGVLTLMGRSAEATAIYDSILANADSLTSFDLFDVGVSLFRQAQGDTARADSARRLERFGKSARAFELGLAKNPQLRDALYNLTNTYLALNDTARALDAARRLVAVDPANSQSLRLLAAAYQRYAAAYGVAGRNAQASRDTAAIRRIRPLLTAYQDSTVQVLGRSDSLAFEVQISRFQPGDSTAVLRGGVINRQSRELAGFTLTIEFINQGGEVVAREAVDVATLAPLGAGTSQYDFSLTVNGRGIIAYRYRLP